MAENQTNNPEHERNVSGKSGNAGEGQQQQQAPGRNLNDDQSTGQRGADRGGDQGTERKGQGQGGFEQGGGERGGSEGRQNR